MNPTKTHVSRLAALPQDLLGLIVLKIGATDPEAYHHCLSSCKELGASADDERVCKTLNLAPLVKHPLAVVRYIPMLKKCLANNNPDAHYIKGIIRYFLLDDSTLGLHHLRLAADAGKEDAIYITGILLLCQDKIEEGKSYLTKLIWEEDTAIVQGCWKNIKTTLHGIRVRRKAGYLASLQKMRPHNFCHLNDLDTTCADCFYYKMMKKFIYMI